MYSKKYESISKVGPAFEELSTAEMESLNGGAAWTSAAAKAIVAATAWSNVACAVSATVVACAVTGAYIYYKK